jgi:glycosyl hydrolase family 2/HEAT repeat protein
MALRWTAALLIGVAFLPAPACGSTASDIAALRKDVQTRKGIARRRAARKLIAMGAPAKAAILELAKSDDIVIRRAALRRVIDISGAEALPVLTAALADPSPLVRAVVVEELIGMKPRTPAVKAALMQATQDKDTAVRKAAASAFWTFRRNVVPLRKRPGWDHAIEVIAKKALPTTGWKFRADPSRVGHVRNWFGPKLDEKDWHAITIDKFWHDALPKKVGKHEGIGWYRTVVTFPAKPKAEFNEVVLHFEAVDESTWLWVNGKYAGVHDMGPGGWRTPFDVDIGPFVKWGQPNHIAVRVLNTAGAGGIYKPVEFQVLK